jgi:V/A-type H+-transporting ATPase subunit B
MDKDILKFGILFEKFFINQDENSDRNFIETLNLGWKLISIMSKDQVIRIKREYIEKYYINNFNPDELR